MTHQKLLTMLAGCNSQKPMAFDALVKASGLLPSTLEILMEQMAHSTPMAINRATVTKDGRTQMMIWPTGVINHPGRQMLIINQKQLLAARAAWEQQPRTAQVKPSASTLPIPSKEISMGAAPSNLNTTIYNKVVEHPGIGRDELVKFALQQVPGATEKQAKKTIVNLVYSSGRIRLEGTHGKPVYYIAEFDKRAAVPASPAVKKQEAKPAVRELSDREFSLSLTDDNYMHLYLGEETVMLNPAQVERLQDFMGRITLTGNRA